MKNKSIFIQLLVLLLTFQSIWNVAEAACLDEVMLSTTQNTPLQYKQIELAQTQALSTSHKQIDLNDKVEQYCQDVCFQENSCLMLHHICLEADAKEMLLPEIKHKLDTVLHAFKDNLYQSPFLSSLNPPPQRPALL